MNKEKIKGLISVSRKAGYLIIGADNLKGYTQKIYLILMEKSSGKNLIKTAKNLKQNTNANLYEVDCLYDYTNIEGCKLVAIKNKGLAEQIEKLLKE